ncbi:hypothetical protein LNP17_05965 [Klebsiella variicola subsp. variicola]|nr:hypothetical protein [Klebsiella variicola subsp. variicola]
MMLDLGEYQEESVNIIAIMGPHGVYHKDEPIKELEAALQPPGLPDHLAAKQRRPACSLLSTTRASAG